MDLVRDQKMGTAIFKKRYPRVHNATPFLIWETEIKSDTLLKITQALIKVIFQVAGISVFIS